MKYGHVDRLIERYLDGRLSPALTDRVRGHLELCPRCRVRADEALRVIEVLSRGTAPSAPEGFAMRVMQRVRQEARVTSPAVTAQKPYAPVFRRLGYSCIAAAALLSVSLFIPKLAYPDLIGSEAVAASLADGHPAAVARILNDAGMEIRQVVGENPQILR